MILENHRKYYEVHAMKFSETSPGASQNNAAANPPRKYNKVGILAFNIGADANPARKYHGIGTLVLVIESAENSSLENICQPTAEITIGILIDIVVHSTAQLI
jgi:hypothetical protein